MVNSFASGHRSAFSQTCNLLRQYVKEKKAVGDRLGMFGGGDDRGQNDVFRPTTMSLFPVNKMLGEEQISNNTKSMDLFPQQGSFVPQFGEVKSSPMTIFYAGQVIVFNDFPAHKAKEIMELASRGIVPPKSATDNIPVVSNTGTNNSPQIQECAQQSTAPIVTDLPIARKASLHRFLEKRKDRIKAKAPYSTSKPGDDVPSKHDQSNPWLGLGAAPSSRLSSIGDIFCIDSATMRC